VSRLDTETAEQPAALARFVATVPGHLTALRELAAGCRGVTLAARGSSDNAARYGQYLVPLRSGLPVTLATPSLSTVYGRAPRMTDQLVVAVSQSGRSPDIVAVLAAARSQGRPTVAVTNDPQSPLAVEADHVVDLATGPETSVAATKTYLTSLLGMAALALALADPSPGDTGDDPATAELDVLPELVSAALTLAEEPAADIAGDLAGATRAVAVGRGLNLSTAHETALKVTELTGTLVVPFSPADLLHGPVASVGPDVPVLLIAPDEPASASVLEIVPGLRARGARVHVVGDAAGYDVDTVVPLPAGVPGWLSPVVAMMAGQRVARHLAALRGVDLDHPGGLSKVTVTT